MAVSKRMLLTILAVFGVVFFLFMSLSVYGMVMESTPLRNDAVDQQPISLPQRSREDLAVAPDQDDASFLSLISADLEMDASSAEQWVVLLREAGYPVREDTASAAERLRTEFSSPEFSSRSRQEQINRIVLAVMEERGSLVRTLTGAPEKIAVWCPDPASETARQLISWCGYTGYSYRLFDEVPLAAQLLDYDVLLTDIPASKAEVDRLREDAQLGLVIIFTQAPSAGAVSADPDLAQLMGIESVIEPATSITSIHVFEDFYLSDDRIYEADDYYGETDDIDLVLPWYRLRAGYKVYAAADLQEDDIAPEEMPPLLWRTVYSRSRVFVIGSDIFSGEALGGTVSAMIAQASDVYVYPVVNAQTMSILGFPYMGKENDETLSRYYGHKADTLSWSVLWPGVVQALHAYDQQAAFFISACSDYETGSASQDTMAVYFMRQIQKQLGSMALTLQQRSSASLETVLEANTRLMEEFAPDWRFSAVYAGDFAQDELTAAVHQSDGLLSDVSMIIQGVGDQDELLRVSDDGILRVRLTTDGFSHEALDDIRMISRQTMLLMDNQYIDMERVLYPESGDDLWNRLSVIWSSGVTYYQDYSMADHVKLEELERRARIMLGITVRTVREQDRLRITIDGLPEGESCRLVIRLSAGEPSEVTGGQLRKIIGGSWLLRADQSEIVITLNPVNELGMP